MVIKTSRIAILAVTECLYGWDSIHIIIAKKFRTYQVHHVPEKLLPVFSLAGRKHGPEPAALSQHRASLIGITLSTEAAQTPP